MKRTWTIIGVADVPSSVTWYQTLFGQPATPPAHDYFGRIVDATEPSCSACTDGVSRITPH